MPNKNGPDAAPRYAPVLLGLKRQVHALDEGLVEALRDRGHNELTADQALILVLMEDGRTPEWMAKNAYVGSNISYNLRKLIEHGFVTNERSTIDRRQLLFSRTPKGQEMAEVVSSLLDGIKPANSNTAPSVAA